MKNEARQRRMILLSSCPPVSGPAFLQSQLQRYGAERSCLWGKLGMHNKSVRKKLINKNKNETFSFTFQFKSLESLKIIDLGVALQLMFLQNMHIPRTHIKAVCNYSMPHGELELKWENQHKVRGQKLDIYCGKQESPHFKTRWMAETDICSCRLTIAHMYLHLYQNHTYGILLL